MLDWNRKPVKDYLENVYPQKLYRDSKNFWKLLISASLLGYKNSSDYFGRAQLSYREVYTIYLYEQIQLQYIENLFSQAQTPHLV